MHGPMEDVLSALLRRPRPRLPSGFIEPVRRRSMEPRHRRRRAIAMAGLGSGLILFVVLLVAGGGRRVHHLIRPGPPSYFARLRALAGNGPESFAGRERAAENRAIDRTLAYTPYVRVAGAQHREIALTFDDGPGPYTPQILSILERRNVPATFFEVGVLERYFHASTSQIVERGYVIGDHTESHAAMAKLSPRQQRDQLVEQMAVIRRYGAPFPRLFRPPYGLWNAATLKLLRRYRMLMVLWTIDTSDYRHPGVKMIVRTVLARVRPGAIILLHDAGGDRSETVAALPKIIAALRARHYRFATVPRLLLDNPAPRNQQISSVIGAGG